ncbi:MAG: indole-3-glycerol phosphate synthase TrpC, partial [Elusimicrobia bacterium]|nr:indole-3-glycerol phosphate synthase TrpC [Elusimicrobiota bacterium]
RTKERVTRNKKEFPLNNKCYTAANPYCFENALRAKPMAFICEVKKASPSKGVIDPVFDYKKIASDYAAAGANALSVLTEPYFFMGSDNFLKEIKSLVNIPVLRKDFTIDEYQIYQACVLGADAVLLIVSILDYARIKDFLSLAAELGLATLVETHDEYEVETALKAGTKILGVNNRDLKTFKVDINTSVRLKKYVPDDVLFVAESGIETAEDIKVLAHSNINGVLVGEALMRAQCKINALKELKKYL